MNVFEALPIVFNERGIAKWKAGNNVERADLLVGAYLVCSTFTGDYQKEIEACRRLGLHLDCLDRLR